MDPQPNLDPAQRRRQVICGSVLVAVGVYRLVLLFSTPSLIGSHPVLLEALRGSTASLITGGAFAKVGRASLVVALLVPLPTLMMSDPFVWWAGRLWGPEVIELIAGRGASERRGTQRALRYIERGRSWAIVLAPVLPVPSVIIYAAAGWTGMRLRWFIALDLQLGRVARRARLRTRPSRRSRRPRDHPLLAAHHPRTGRGERRDRRVADQPDRSGRDLVHLGQRLLQRADDRLAVGVLALIGENRALVGL
jgi:membrane protein DedA with SNARE-associated domain